MSAESPKRVARGVPSVVPPEPVSDRSIIESVTGFINEVTLTNVPQADPKDTIQWVRFETTADVGDPSFGEDWDLESGVPPPLLLILGYGTGIQVWAIPANGEAVEVLSWRHGMVRALKVLPTPINSAGELADEPSDMYAQKRPLIAICDSCQTGSIGPQFYTLNVVSLKDGDTVKSIKFKSTILDIAANHTAVVVTFAEKIAVFDARTLEDRLTITTCHPSPGLSPNPIALGPRWLAYAERKLMPSKRSGGGCDCDGVSSYTATMLNAAKTLSKGLRELGEQVAAGLTGSSPSQTTAITSNGMIEGQNLHPGIITVLDIKYPIKEASPTTGAPVTTSGNDPIIAHFVAHADVIAAMVFDASGLLLLSADKRGHDFHVFRIHPHPCGSSSAAVHHLYILHRGDTTAKVQDMVFSLDSRWAGITTARGTTHVFPVTPYGGPATYRTHGSAEVVNRLSRFHRSAGLTVDGRSSSPVFHTDNGTVSSDPYHNPRTPPFPRPYVIMPLKQLRQPIVLSAGNSLSQTATTGGSSGQRQRLSSSSEDTVNVLRVCATFARPRDWLLQPPGTVRETPALRNQRNAVDSLFIMAGHGSMIQYDLEPKYLSSIPAARQNDDSAIELHVEARAQWNLHRKDASIEIQPPLAHENWLLKNRMDPKEKFNESDFMENCDDRWLSQVEIVTSSGPHRRLWMGPQFIFKTYNTPSGAPLQHIDSEAVEIGVNTPANRPARSNPMPMPPVTLGGRDVVPVVIESGSASSYEQSPRLVNQYHEYMSSDEHAIAPTDTQLREDLADAMRESPRDSGLSANSSATSSSRTVYVSVGKVVNPLGTVTTITDTPDESNDEANEFSEAYKSGAYIHENCDESMFRPYVAVISGTIDGGKERLTDAEQQRPTVIGQKLIVPVIDGTESIRQREMARREEFDRRQTTEETVAQFEQMSLLNKKDSKSRKDKVKEGNDGSVGNASGGGGTGNAKESNKKRDVVKKVNDLAIVDDVKPDETPAIAPRKSKEKSVEPILKDVDTFVTIKMKKSKKLLATLNDEPVLIANERKWNISMVDVDELKLSDPVVERKPYDEPSKAFKSTLKNRKSKAVPEPPANEDITLITDDILRDEDVQPIIESAKITLSDIMRADTKRNDQKEKSPEPTESNRKQKKRPIEDRVIEIVEAVAPSGASNAAQDDSGKTPYSDESTDNSKSIDVKLKKLNRKQRKLEKLEKLAAEATRISPESTIPPAIKSETTEFTFTLKKNSVSPAVPARRNEFDDMTEILPPADDGNDDITVLENFDKTLTGDFTHIQDSLMNPVVSATISIRKPSLKDRADSEEKLVANLTKKEKRKNSKNASKELELDTIAMNTNNSYRDANLSDPECSFAEPNETFEPDSLSFKSTTDDPVSLINLESPLLESTNAVSSSVRTTASDETESNADAQFSDCKSFDMVASSEEPYIELKQSDTVSSFDLVLDDAYTQLKQSDTNSSDETEDSSQGKPSKPKVHDDDDEELEPLISSTLNLQSDTASEIPKQIIDIDDTISSTNTTTTITLPEETNQSDSTKHQQSNKKKSRKKRR